uniref:Olfactory receptor n=1 Tax=Xenopus tropicalis TaxID=8364 RepID=A0A6I8SLZ7_XENTR
MMTDKNQSSTNGFILQGFSGYTQLRVPLLCLFLLIYLVTLLTNVLISAVIYRTSLWHTPMYFFLCNLAFIDIFTTSIYQPKIIFILLTQDSTISFGASCLAQFYFFITFTCAEMLILTVMAYDRYVAICHPLTYPFLMNKKTCIFLTVASWTISLLDPVTHTVSISQLTFCPPLLINHFYCDLSVVLRLSCKDTFLIDILTYFGSMVGCCAFICMIISYSYIISTVLKIKSGEGRQKGFSTCGSHLIVVLLYYGTILTTYLRPSSQYSSSKGKPFSVIYTVLIPMVNPFIYTLRNRDVKKAFGKLLKIN